MKKRLHGLIAGVLIGATVTGGAVFATTGTKSYLVDVCPPYQGQVYWIHTSKDSSNISVAGKMHRTFQNI